MVTGCCFIKYATSEEADRAIRALHNQYTLPGGVGPIQVRYADGERERLGAFEYKLFVGSLNKQATVKEVEEFLLNMGATGFFLPMCDACQIFTPYGRVEDVYLMRDEMKQSRGCGFVKYSHRDMALAAINALNGNYTMRGCDQPLTVRFADPKRPRLGDTRGLPLCPHKGLYGCATLCGSRGPWPLSSGKGSKVRRPLTRQSSTLAMLHMATIDLGAQLARSHLTDPLLSTRLGDGLQWSASLTRLLAELNCSKGGPAFGGPGFSPHFQAPELSFVFALSRGPPNFSDGVGDRMAPSAWNPMNAQNLGPSSFSGHPNFGGQLFPKSGDVSKPLNPNVPLGGPTVPTDGLLPSPAAPSSSMAQQSFQPFQQFPSGVQQIAPQMSLQSPQQLLHSQSHNQPSTSYTQTQHSYAMLGQLNQLQTPPLATPFSQPLPSQPLVGSSGQLSSTHPAAQQTASSMTVQQTPLNMNLLSQPRPAATNQPQVTASAQQHLLQSFQQSPSPLAQKLSQQTQALQASYQSSQQAFSQLQQQLQMMQPSNLNAVPQQALPTNQQPQWNNNVQQPVVSTSTNTTAAEVPSSSSVAPAIPVSTPNLAPAKCIWTEHTSPDGFKYYYNSVTGESRWLEPEELKIFRQQQQQQQQQPPKSSVQLTHAQPPQLLPPQQGAQTQQLQQQSQLQGQLPQQLLQQPLLSSSYHASMLPSHQNIQELGYSQFQAAANSVNDPAHFQQGFQVAQQWMLKNNFIWNWKLWQFMKAEQIFVVN
ncbi:hypothetical protein EUGRSUZ_H04064 [Eucalyptus grandis]|uniref:Uncharacterized protein n=2 Tax=Eucalyptus grandis TaxID=71139 RepID=A0ACC3JWD0_EUCGR|nr:hypothetical protein EUGRSUZ_H04064 [Eucalyptus grandis]